MIQLVPIILIIVIIMSVSRWYIVQNTMSYYPCAWVQVSTLCDKGLSGQDLQYLLVGASYQSLGQG